MKNQKANRGGARTGAGRKPQNKPTRTVSFRIPEDAVEILAANDIENPAAFYRAAGEKALKKLSRMKKPAP